MKKFWYVHNRASGNPRHRHETLESAIEEAKRLASTKVKNFYILESVCKVTPEGKVDKEIESYGE